MSTNELTVYTRLEWRYGQNATQEYFDARIGRARISAIRNKSEGKWFVLRSEEEQIQLVPTNYYADINDLILQVEKQLLGEDEEAQQTS